MKKKYYYLFVIVAILFLSVYQMTKSSDSEIVVSNILINDIEAVAGCETSSDKDQNTGYCEPKQGELDDACVKNGTSTVRCSGNY